MCSWSLLQLLLSYFTNEQSMFCRNFHWFHWSCKFRSMHPMSRRIFLRNWCNIIKIDWLLVLLAGFALVVLLVVVNQRYQWSLLYSGASVQCPAWTYAPLMNSLSTQVDIIHVLLVIIVEQYNHRPRWSDWLWTRSSWLIQFQDQVLSRECSNRVIIVLDRNKFLALLVITFLSRCVRLLTSKVWWCFNRRMFSLCSR
jgi:hypothetical protein